MNVDIIIEVSSDSGDELINRLLFYKKLINKELSYLTTNIRIAFT